jgi:hypothetical protein
MKVHFDGVEEHNTGRPGLPRRSGHSNWSSSVSPLFHELDLIGLQGSTTNVKIISKPIRAVKVKKEQI